MKNAIDESIYFIENRLTDDINIAALAKHSFFSISHYQRIFRAIVGEPVMEYVKNRRLQLACFDLLSSKSTILEIALKYGYESHDGFTRAFKSYFGTTPSKYRKTKKEVTKMLSNETLNRIGQNAERISGVLTKIVNDAKVLVDNARKEAKNEIYKGVIIMANELENLAKRIKYLKDNNIKTLLNPNLSAFEMSDKILFIIKCLDEIFFQMKLLRFLSGVEIGRISPPKDIFEAIDTEYDKLCNELADNRQIMIEFMTQAIELIYADIRQDVNNSTKKAVNMLYKAIKEGENTAVLMQAAAISFEERGREFIFIKERVKETINILKNAEDCFKDTVDLNNAAALIQNAAFNMNINAFNTAIASARAGDTPKSKAAAEQILNYADILQQTVSEFEFLLNEYNRLFELIKYKQSQQALVKKHLDDLIFQGGILSSQFALEAERINRDTFRHLAQTADTAHINFVQTKNTAQYCLAIEKFLQELNKEVANLEIGGSFAYFAKEYESYKSLLL